MNNLIRTKIANNKLFIIGNGFDLAHKLKTSYSDFILWYFKKIVYEIGSLNHYSNKLIEIKTNGNAINDISDSLDKLRKTIRRREITFKFLNPFFETIVKKTTNLKWVDIEYEYYQNLLTIYRKFESSNLDRNNGFENQLNKLNDCFYEIKLNLIEYLNTIDISTTEKIAEISKIINEEIEPNRLTGEPQHLFLTFNYTNLLDLYLKYLSLKSNISIINIHGELNDDRNPIIFGYGDEKDSYYSKIERLNINQFLINFKSFNYFKTSNYQNLTRFIESEEYSVVIIGHSCGISDRILLNSIFENDNCKSIKIYYHQKDEKHNDYFDKTLEISRHFSADNKHDMRNKIISFENSQPLIKYKTT